MTRTLYLHVGLPKTASTALQETLFPRLRGLTVRSLPRGDLFRGAKDRRAEGRLFACAMRRDPSVWSTTGEAIWASMAVPEDDRPLLVSDEGIGRAGTRPALLAEHLREVGALARRHGFDRLAVIAVIRRQADWLASHYAQLSNRQRGAGQADFERSVARHTDPARGLHGFGTLLRYDLLESALREAADEVLLLPTEAMRRDQPAFERDILCFLGLPTEESEGAGATPRNVRSAGEGRWRLRPATIDLPGGRQLPLPSRPAEVTLTPEIEAAVERAYGEANARLAGRTGLPLAELGYAVAPGAG